MFLHRMGGQTDTLRSAFFGNFSAIRVSGETPARRLNFKCRALSGSQGGSIHAKGGMSFERHSLISACQWLHLPLVGPVTPLRGSGRRGWPEYTNPRASFGPTMGAPGPESLSKLSLKSSDRCCKSMAQRCNALDAPQIPFQNASPPILPLT